MYKREVEATVWKNICLFSWAPLPGIAGANQYSGNFQGPQAFQEYTGPTTVQKQGKVAQGKRAGLGGITSRYIKLARDITETLVLYMERFTRNPI